jgi:ribonuclease BN (tRNA processing enzyme)
VDDSNADRAAGLSYRTLGAGTLLPSDHLRSAAHLVEVDDAAVLLDIGHGTVHGFARHGVDWARITHVVLSHFHTDHLGDLAPYLFALTYGLHPEERTLPLVVVGPPGLGRVMAGLAQAHGPWVLEPPFALQVVELERSDVWDDPGGRFRLVCHPTPHTPESVSWRVETAHGVVGYTGDTGPDPEVGRFLAGSVVLACECAVPDGSDVPIHLTPGQVAELALLARPDLLVLTHVYPPLVPAETPALVRAAGYHGRVVAARDGDRVRVRDGRAVPATSGDA